MRVLITGGAGFLGSHLVDRLIRDEHEVIVFDNLLTGRISNIEHHFGANSFKFIKQDVTEYLHVGGELDAVVHFASPASPVDYLRLPIQTLKVGGLGTHKALGLAKEKGSRFLLASTSEVYGDPQVHPQTEDYWGHVNPVGPRGVYDEAKRFAEALTMAYHRAHGLDTRIVRIFNTYGDRMRPDDGRVVSNFIVQALNGYPITVYGDGHQTRSFCYVSDLISGISNLLLKEDSEDVHLPVNMGNPDEFTVISLARKVIEISGSSSVIEHKPLPVDDPQFRQPDISRAVNLLKWMPVVRLDSGLWRTIEYFKSIALLGLFVIDCLSLTSFPQNQQHDVIKLESTLVQVPVTVSNAGGRYITDLKVEDFKVFENGIEQSIHLFKNIDEPFNVALLIDSSGSTLDQLRVIKSAALAFVNSLREHDKVMVISFSDSVVIMCELTSDHKVLYNSILNISGGEYTQFYEAMYTAVWEKLRHIEGRKAVIVFSDGIDTSSSEISEEDTLNAVAASDDVIIYLIRYNTRTDVERKLFDREYFLMGGRLDEENWNLKRRKLDQVYRKASEYIQELADISGGVVKQADVLVDLEAVFAEIAEELRHQYLLGYYSSKRDEDGEFRKILVRTSRRSTELRIRVKRKF